MFKHGKLFSDGTLRVLSHSGNWIKLKEAAEKYNTK